MEVGLVTGGIYITCDVITNGLFNLLDEPITVLKGASNPGDSYVLYYKS